MDERERQLREQRARERARERRRTQSGSRNRSYGRPSRRREPNKALPVIIIIAAIAILCAAFGVKLYIDRYSYSKVQADLSAYYQITDTEDVPIIMGHELSEKRARLIDGAYYLDYQSVRDLLNARFYYGPAEGIVIYCFPTYKITTVIGEKTATDDAGNVTDYAYAPAVMEGETLYLALDYVKQYTNFGYQTFTEPERIALQTEFSDRTVATIKKDTAIRTSGGVKSDVVRDLSKDENVTIVEKMETWSKVETNDAMIGYVENKFLVDEQTVTDTPVTDYVEPEFTRIQMNGKVNLAWHGIAGTAGNDTLYSLIEQTKSVNVLSPTWFVLRDDQGNIESYATKKYVDDAHAMGIQVWALVDNFTNPNVSPNTVLTTLASRTNLISQLISQCTTYGIDGINVDFEDLSAENGENFEEFIREISIACRNNGLVLSVDNYVKYDFNDYYGLEEQGVFADYVIVMGYDEHYAGSTEAGSVASLSYVTHGIQSALADVPADKLINGIPFYSRIWITTADGLRSEALGMQDIQDFMTNHGMVQSYLDAEGQNYAEVTEGDTKYQIWVEDAQSIEAKLSVMRANGIAGVAEWKLGFETADVWDTIQSYITE